MVEAKDKSGTDAGPVKGLRGFKNTSDIENFYRFVKDHSLRREAHMAIGKLVEAIKKSQKSSRRKKRQKKQ